MNNQNIDEQMPDELSQAIRSVASMKVPADSVQRVISQSSKLATSKSTAAPSNSRAKGYLFLACIAVAFLTPFGVRMLGNYLDFLPGWERPSFRGAFAGLSSMIAMFLVWSFGQHLLGNAPQKKRTTSTIGWFAQLATLIVVGLMICGMLARPGNLYAQMRETMANVKTIQYVMTMTDVKTGETMSTTRRFMQGTHHLMRTEQDGGDLYSNVLILDLKEKRCLTLDGLGKTAEFLPLYQIEEMQKNWQEADDFLRGVNPDAKLIGESIANGRPCEDFEVCDDGCTTTISIDKETSLPIQMKMVMDEIPQFTTLAAEFVFDEALDPELFSMKVPAGYTTTDIERKEAVDDSGLELVSGENFGAAKFGMTVDQVIQIVGEPDQTSDFEDVVFISPDVADNPLEILKVSRLNYASRGFEIGVEKEQGLIEVHCFGMLTGSRIFQGQISGGIKMGDSVEAVQKTMGDPSRKPMLEKGESPGDLVYDLPNGSMLRFVFEESKLALVVSRKKDDLPTAAKE